jgi:hypothetical protein
MLCKNQVYLDSELGINNNNVLAAPEKCTFQIDLSSIQNFISSICILQTTGSCENCGARIVHGGGCSHIRCTWCLHDQIFQQNGKGIIRLFQTDNWFLNAVNKLLNFSINLIRVMKETIKKLLGMFFLWICLCFVTIILLPFIIMARIVYFLWLACGFIYHKMVLDQ